MQERTSRATYIYGVARPFHPSHLWGVRGVGGAAVHVVCHGELVAIVSTLSLTGTGAAALRVGSADPAATEAIARAHRSVIVAVSEHSPTLPFRAATIYESERRVIEMLRTGRGRFDRALALLDSHNDSHNAISAAS